jgi:DNA-directed RNA polymerase subunit RPC12/RpoP
MYAAEKNRKMVTAEELESTRDILTKARVPRPRNPKPGDEKQKTEFACMRCGHRWDSIFSVNQERACPDCRSNSVRGLRQSN